jgi:hypothetical protein
VKKGLPFRDAPRGVVAHAVEGRAEAGRRLADCRWPRAGLPLRSIGKTCSRS